MQMNYGRSYYFFLFDPATSQCSVGLRWRLRPAVHGTNHHPESLEARHARDCDRVRGGPHLGDGRPRKRADLPAGQSSFGGNPFNSDHLLATADIQNKYADDDEDRAGLPQLSPSEQFARTIQSRLLSRVSLEIADRIFGEDAQDSGEFRFADTVITFNRQDGIIHLVLFDEATGSETVIDIPDTGF